MGNILIHIVLIFGFVSFSYATVTYGVDVSTLTSTAAFQCLKTSTPIAYTHVIVRAWKSSGLPDTNCPQTIANAVAAGMTNVDVYFFPCFTCGDVATQVQTSVNYLATNGAGNSYRIFWLDVEGTWSTNTTANQVFFQQMLSAAVSAGVNVGIYTSKSQWTAIMGSASYNGASTYPLWYPRYDNLSNFDDFVAFGGWSNSSVAMKQYQPTTSICGASVDFNYATAYPLPSVTPSPSPSPAAFSAPTWESNVSGTRAGAKLAKCLINGDSYIDLVVTGVSTAYVFLGTSSGTYPTTPSYTLPIYSPTITTDGLAVDCVDVNQDGYADVLVGNWTATPSYVHVFNGTSGGLSTTPANLVYSSGSGHYFGAAITHADFNNDGKMDVAVGAYGLGRVFIHYGLGAAGLNPTRDAPAILYTNTMTYGQNLATCDFSNDGYPDLLVGARSQNSATGQLYIYSNVAGTFQASINRTGAAASAYYGYDASCGDVNGDGNKDLVVLSYGDKLLYIYYGTGNINTLPTTASVVLSLVDGARSISVADQNLDGYADLIVGHHATNKVRIWYGGPALNSASTANFVYTGPTGNSGWSVTHIGNIDARGRSELAFGTYTYGSTETNEGLVGVLYNS